MARSVGVRVLHDIVLKGRHVTLEPLRVEHAEELAAAIQPGCDACAHASVPCTHGDDVYRWLYLKPRTPDEMRQWIVDRQTDRAPLVNYPFLQRDPATGRAMGSTSLFDVDRAMRSAEIGHTWIVAPYRRTGVNTEAKLMLLTHAFETLGLARVQIVTDVRNERSRNAILRLGAKFEGILRNHRRGFDGELRDSPYYSIIDREWPETKAGILRKLHERVG